MKSLYKMLLSVCILLFTVVFSTEAQMVFNPVTSGLSAPMEIVAPPDGTGRMFIVQRGGTVRIYSGTSLIPGNFLDISSLVSLQGERGFLSMAFHPGYATNRYFFVLYTDQNGDLVLSRYQTDPLDANQALTASGTILLTIPHPGQSNHNGGKIAFGTDGNLFWSTGDGGGGNDPLNNAQNGTSLLGKMLRINVDDFATAAPFYTIPADNPFITDPSVADEIWNIGLRNPFRWSFDRLNGDMWIADVGQDAWEEVNQATLAASSGLNYGWRCREGAHPNLTAGCAPSGYTDPVFEYAHTVGTSITGGYVYRGAGSPPLAGKYICIDFVSGNGFVVTPGGTPPFSSVMQAGLPTNITGFGEDATGELYAVSIGGTLYQVTAPVIPLPVELISFGYIKGSDCHSLQWMANEKDIRDYQVERSSDGKSFSTIGRQAALNTAGEHAYLFPLCDQPVQDGYYRLRISGMDGQVSYSKVLVISAATNGGDMVIYPTEAHDRLHIKTTIPWQHLSCTDMTGRTVLNQQEARPAGYSAIDISMLTPGMYFAHLTDAAGRTVTQRFMVSR